MRGFKYICYSYNVWIKMIWYKRAGFAVLSLLDKTPIRITHPPKRKADRCCHPCFSGRSSYRIWRLCRKHVDNGTTVGGQPFFEGSVLRQKTVDFITKCSFLIFEQWLVAAAFFGVESNRQTFVDVLTVLCYNLFLAK